MKKTLLFIFAIPIGLVASIILPTIFSKILSFFIPLESITSFIDQYVITILCGWLAVGVTALIVPSKKILFASLMLLINIIATMWMFYKGNDFNYLFIVGGILALIVVITNKDELSATH